MANMSAKFDEEPHNGLVSISIMITSLSYVSILNLAFDPWPPKSLNDLSCGSSFHNNTPISFIKSYGFYFCVGEIFAKKAKLQKHKNCPHAKILRFIVYQSMQKKSVENCISSILSWERGIIPTKIEAKWRHSNLICSL